MKAQVFSFDLMIGMVIFFSVFGFIIFVWDYVEKEITYVETRSFLEYSSINTADMLTNTGGSPNNWTIEHYYYLGLASSKKTLSEDKVDRFLSYCLSNYTSIKDAVSLSLFNFEWDLSYPNGTIIKKFERLRRSAEELSTQKRYVYYNQQPAVFTLRVWKK